MKIRKNGNLLKRAKERVAESAEQTEEYAKNPGRLRRLVFEAKDKLMQMDARRYNLRNFIMHISVLSRMIKDYSAGIYPHLPNKTMLSVVGTLLYFVNPFDIIPDFIPFIGYLDDITLLAWVYRSIEGDVDKYLDWSEAEAEAQA